ncbi:succinate-semialdehyde dehydrogenase (NADP(+)) [Marinococcus halophilus]|uniref:NAD-dependent succinate-semialdehyde dehydrogenase n=1 Tax=Marinococcus halophilus TaxID=1371 RepID=A0A510Y958_MARHA|nr:NAD-dependent succinate-semialdehyde dehydrogenase [Marinococcus halophilus]OZT79095.1 succinate-semialdehyde dehydrogenase (NADP(+)) [Marinococcus halophilus]GEK59922.1 NAD-dependent succinate-semialdehyde dehydrogenase [Marinococcus halophilus]
MLYINGTWQSTEQETKVYNPADGTEVGKAAYGGETETEQAITAAHEAFGHWRQTTGNERSRCLRALAEALRTDRREIAITATKEMGKPLGEAEREVDISIDYLEWYAEEAKRVYGEVLPSSDPSKQLLVLRQPIGVTAAITPWNFPISMIIRKLAPAIAAGCTMLIKPAPSTPLTAIRLFTCIDRSGFPPGALNLLHGDAEAIGGTMTSNALVKKITFTGSTAVGKQLIRQSAEHVQKVSMELGGHAPFIIFDDADLDEAVAAVVASKFRNTGQTCISTNRIYVHEEVVEVFSKKLAAAVESITVGNGMEEGIDMGPLISQEALDKVAQQVKEASKQGAVITQGGHTMLNRKGYFYQPTVLTGVTETMTIAQEETFGPVAPIFVFTTEQEVIEQANDTPYGLASYCFTKNMDRSLRMMYQLDYGMVGMNDAAFVVPQAPFGGVKQSGIGREGGTSGLHEYLEEKYVSMRAASTLL